MQITYLLRAILPVLPLFAHSNGNVASDVFLRGKGCGGPGKEIRVVDLLFYDREPEDECVQVTRVNEDSIDSDGDPGKHTPFEARARIVQKNSFALSLERMGRVERMQRDLRDSDLAAREDVRREGLAGAGRVPEAVEVRAGDRKARTSRLRTSAVPAYN